MTRRSRVQDKKTTRNAIYLVLGSIALFLFLIFFGLPFFARIAIFLSELKKSSQPVQQEDKVPPGPPRINPLPSHTNTDTVTVSGAAEAGSTFKLYLNDEVVKESVIDDTSLYSFDIELSRGKNTFQATAKDQTGNESEKSTPLVVIYSDEEPTLIISSPQDGETIEGQKSITVQGKTDSGNRVTINERVVIVDDEGNFSTKINLTDGENSLKFSVEDEAGNLLEKEIKVNYAS